MITFGPNVSQTEYDENIFQGQQPTCAIRSQELIMRDFGIQIPQEELKQYAIRHGWFESGTPENCVGNLLETCGIKTHSAHCNSVYDLINELKEGHRVIVAVDSRELWAEEGTPEHEFWKQRDSPDHALLVTSFNIDVKDPSNSFVMLTDPGSGAILKRRVEHFAHAWGDSNFFMVATDDAAPYQYNPELKCMEMSNFATDFSLNEFPFHNEFSDIWEVESLGYVPFYGEGHLNFISDGVSYDDFLSHYLDSDYDWLSTSFESNDSTDFTSQGDDWSMFTDIFMDFDSDFQWNDTDFNSSINIDGNDEF